VRQSCGITRSMEQREVFFRVCREPSGTRLFALCHRTSF